jgi:phosphoglycerate dehydrogenase-like enzyme
MTMPRILIDELIDDSALRRLQALSGITVEVLPRHDSQWDLPDEWLHGSEVLLCKEPPCNFDRMTDLKLIQISSVGYENLRDLGMADRPLSVCNARGTCDTPIGEWNLAMMVNLARDLRGMVRNQEQAHWQRAPQFQREVRGRVVGLWGYGGIGRETARLAKAFGMIVHAMTRSGVKPRHDIYTQPGTGDPDGILPNRVFVAGQEGEFLSGLDFLVLALPHTRHSDGMVGVDHFRAMRPTAFVINPARGPIIQEEGLLRALRENWIAGAALDTHFAYPLPADHPLWRFPNVILTPHISGAYRSVAFPARLADLFTQNVMRHLESRPLLNLITAREWREA